jgi:hypothetical protein
VQFSGTHEREETAADEVRRTPSDAVLTEQSLRGVGSSNPSTSSSAPSTNCGIEQRAESER